MLPDAPGAEELGRFTAARSRACAPAGGNHPAALREDAPPEVGSVEAHTPDGLVDRPQLGQGECRSDKCSRDAAKLQVDADALHRITHYTGVIERELDAALLDVGDRNQGGIGRVGPGEDAGHLAKDGKIRNSHHVHAWVTPGIAIGADLSEKTLGVDAGSSAYATFLIVFGCFVLGVLVFGTYAFAFSTPVMIRLYTSAKRWIQLGVGIMFAIAAFGLLAPLLSRA